MEACDVELPRFDAGPNHQVHIFRFIVGAPKTQRYLFTWPHFLLKRQPEIAVGIRLRGGTGCTIPRGDRYPGDRQFPSRVFICTGYSTLNDDQSRSPLAYLRKEDECSGGSRGYDSQADDNPYPAHRRRQHHLGLDAHLGQIVVSGQIALLA